MTLVHVGQLVRKDPLDPRAIPVQLVHKDCVGLMVTLVFAD